jgi:hypothetical protein
MNSNDLKPRHHPAPDTIMYRASPARVARTLAPFVAFLLVGCAAQYALNGALSAGMEWVIAGFGAFALFAVAILPRTNYLECSPEQFTLCELMSRKRIAWCDIEPSSIGCTIRTFYFIPLFSTIGFRLMPLSAPLSSTRTCERVNRHARVFHELVPDGPRRAHWHASEISGRVRHCR